MQQRDWMERINGMFTELLIIDIGNWIEFLILIDVNWSRTVDNGIVLSVKALNDIINSAISVC